MDLNNVFNNELAVIPANESVSNAVDLKGLSLVALIVPSVFSGSAISFQISVDNINFYDIFKSSNILVSVAVTQGRAYAFTPGDFVSARYLKIKSNSIESAQRTLKLITRAFT